MADVVVAAADSARSTTTTPTSTRQQQPRPVDDDDASDDHHQDVASTQRQTRSARAFPPPISVIGGSGRPWLRLRAHREGGRLVLREMRLPSQEMLRPCKEGGRFKLLVHPVGAAGTAAREGR